MIKSKKLRNFREISHGFFSKSGGISTGIYKGLNCGVGSYDNKNNVIKNLKIVCKKFGISKRKLILLNQNHTDKFHLIDEKYNFNKETGDALITKKRGIALGVLTADCVPIFVYDKKKKIISAIHAGWRGAYKGIVLKVIKFMLKNGSQKKDLIAVIGPCIAQKSYEVQKDFFNKNSSIFVTQYQGLTVKQIDELRAEMRKHGILFKITKNRITKLALEGTKFKKLDSRNYFIIPASYIR